MRSPEVPAGKGRFTVVPPPGPDPVSVTDPVPG